MRKAEGREWRSANAEGGVESRAETTSLSFPLRTTGETLRNVSWIDERKIRVKDFGGGEGEVEGDVEDEALCWACWVGAGAGLTTVAMHAGGRNESERR